MPARKAPQAEQQNADLAAMNEQLIDLYQRKLQKYGYPGDEAVQELQAIQQRLQVDADMDAQERQQLSQQFNAGVTQLQQAQEQAQNDPDVQNATRAYEAKRMQAMTEVNPEAASLQSDLESVHQELIQKQEQLQQQLQH